MSKSDAILKLTYFLFLFTILFSSSLLPSDFVNISPGNGNTRSPVVTAILSISGFKLKILVKNIIKKFKPFSF